jgi:hypothetical protein
VDLIVEARKGSRIVVADESHRNGGAVPSGRGNRKTIAPTVVCGKRHRHRHHAVEEARADPVVLLPVGGSGEERRQPVLEGDEPQRAAAQLAISRLNSDPMDAPVGQALGQVKIEAESVLRNAVLLDDVFPGARRGFGDEFVPQPSRDHGSRLGSRALIGDKPSAES